MVLWFVLGVWFSGCFPVKCLWCDVRAELVGLRLTFGWGDCGLLLGFAVAGFVDLLVGVLQV